MKYDKSTFSLLFSNCKNLIEKDLTLYKMNNLEKKYLDDVLELFRQESKLEKLSPQQIESCEFISSINPQLFYLYSDLVNTINGEKDVINFVYKKIDDFIKNKKLSTDDKYKLIEFLDRFSMIFVENKVYP